MVALSVAGAASAALLTPRASGPQLTNSPSCSNGVSTQTVATETAAATTIQLGRPQPSSTGAQTASVSTATETATGSSAAGVGGGAACPEGMATAALPLISASASSAVVFSGHGWGPGVGLSQWGAYGYAEHGWGAAQILAHYYPGTTLGSDPPVTVRVLLSSGSTAVTLASAAPWKLSDAAGTTLVLPAGPLTVPRSLRVAGHRLVAPLTFSSGTSPLEFAGKPYRGIFVLSFDAGMLDVVNAVPMQAYLDGVVGEEMPPSWPAAALAAQAVAARSYALAAIDAAQPSVAFDLYADARSQTYGGIDAESPSVSAAVAETVREVVLYDGRVATTLYSASSGGQTVSAVESDGFAVPYLVSVADPYDTLSPYHDWGPVEVSPAVAGSALGLSGPLLNLETVAGPSHHILSAVAVGESGTTTVSGQTLADDLGLRSSWFSVGWLSLSPPPAAVAPGATVTLTGIVRGLQGAELQAQTGTAAWQTVATLQPTSGGSFALEVSPLQTTNYRLSAGGVDGALITVDVHAA